MSRVFQCPCGQQLSVAVETAAQVRCPICANVLQIPAAEPGQTSPAARPTDAFASPVADRTQQSVEGSQVLTSTGPAKPNTMPQAAQSSRGPKSAGPTWVVRIGIVFALFVLGGLVLGLVQDGEGPNAGKPQNGVKRSGVRRSARPVTSDEATAEAAKFVKNMKARDFGAANRQIDFAELLERSLLDVPFSDRSRNEFNAGFLNNSSNGQLVQRWADGATDFRVLQTRMVEGEQACVLSVSGPDRLDYIEIKFSRDQSEQIRIADFYLYSMGEWFSEIMNRLALVAAAEDNKTLYQRLTGTKSDFVKSMPTIVRITNASSAKVAFNLFKTLPPSLQKDKLLMVQRIKFAMQLGDSEYESALNDFFRYHGDSPAAKVYGIDYYFLKGDLQKTLRVVEDLNQMVGGDAALWLIKANVYVEDDQFVEAEQAVKSALKLDPENAEAQQLLTALANIEK